MNLELKPFTELIDAAVPLTRGALRWCLPAALPLAAIGVLMVVAQTKIYSQLTSAEFDASMWAAFSGVFFASFAWFAWALVASTALAAGALDRLQGKESGFGAGLAWAFSPRVLGTLILTALALMASFALCILPILFVLPLLGLVVPVMRLEQRFGLDALKRSAQLVWFNNTGRMADSGWVFMLGIFFVSWMLSAGLSSVVTLPVMSYQQYVTFDQTFRGEIVDPGQLMADMQVANIAMQVVGALAQAVAWTYAGFASGLFYFEARRRREAYDLEAAIDRLSGTATPE